jgi:hypothetical protein
MQTQKFINQALPIEIQIAKELLTGDGWIIGERADTQSNWTRAVNDVLKKVAKTFNSEYLIACKHKDIHDSPEWLYDFVCYHENELGLFDVIFVAESEWMSWGGRNFEKIKYDFEKLLLARCDIRVMFFEEKGESTIINIIDKLNSIVKHCKMTKRDDRYMYAAYNKSTCDFYVDLHIAN